MFVTIRGSNVIPLNRSSVIVNPLLLAVTHPLGKELQSRPTLPITPPDKVPRAYLVNRRVAIRVGRLDRRNPAQVFLVQALKMVFRVRTTPVSLRGPVGNPFIPHFLPPK